MGIFRYPTVVGAVRDVLDRPSARAGLIRGVSVQLIATVFNGWMYYCLLYFVPQMLQVCRGFSPLKSGYLILPLVVTPGPSTPLSPANGRAADHAPIPNSLLGLRERPGRLEGPGRHPHPDPARVRVDGRRPRLALDSEHVDLDREIRGLRGRHGHRSGPHPSKVGSPS